MVSDFLNTSNTSQLTKRSPEGERSSQSLSSDTSKAQEQFLQLYLANQTITLLPTEQLTEVLTISAERIMPMPHMSPWIMGTYNWRSNMLWLVEG